MYIRPEVSYITYDTSSEEQPGDIITFTHFEDGNLLSKSCNDTESSNESDEDSTLPPLISEEEMDAMLLGDEYDAEHMSIDMLEDICDGCKSNPSINRREAHYKIRDCIKQRQ